MARQRHGRGALLRGLQHQPHILEPQPQGEAGRLECFVGDDFAVIGVHRGGEQRVHRFQEQVRIDPGFAQRGIRFGKSLQHAGDHEIAAQLDGVGLPWLAAGDERLAADGVEQRPRAVQNFGRAGRHHHQLFGFGRIRPSENRRAGESLLARAMSLGQPPRQCRADGAVGDVHGAARQGAGDAIGCEDHLLDGGIVGQHAHDGFAIAAGIGRGIGDARAFLGEGLRFFARAVVDGELVAGAEQVARHSRAHVSESDKSDLHVS